MQRTGLKIHMYVSTCQKMNVVQRNSSTIASALQNTNTAMNNDQRLKVILLQLHVRKVTQAKLVAMQASIQNKLLATMSATMDCYLGMHGAQAGLQQMEKSTRTWEQHAGELRLSPNLHIVQYRWLPNQRQVTYSTRQWSFVKAVHRSAMRTCSSAFYTVTRSLKTLP